MPTFRLGAAQPRGTADVQDAVVRNIEIIGEAVNKINSIAPDFIEQHPER